MEVRKNDIIKGTIIDINDDGQGVLKTLNGEVIFVPNAIVGEEVEVQIINTKSRFAIAKIKKFISTSTLRVNPDCPYYLKCGGCDLMHLNKKSQLEFKTNKIKHLFKKIANQDCKINPCVSLNNLRYRNKIALPVNLEGNIGLYRKNSHTILPISDCVITEQWNKTLIDCLNTYIKKSKISVYNEETKSGLLKHIVARHINNSTLITLVINGEEIPKQNILINLLSKAFDNFGLNLNINKLNNNVILSSLWKPIYGNQELIAEEFNIKYPVSNASFFQVNNEIKLAIYNNVLNEIEPSSVVIDAYSGAGLLSGIISTKAKYCYGVEIIKEATENANKLKFNNNLTNLENINGDCAKILPNLVKKLKNENLIVTLDPPRKGCDKKVLDAIINVNANKILYISCDPSTLARDARIILENNYKIEYIQPYDMFPNTKHVETLVSFVKIK